MHSHWGGASPVDSAPCSRWPPSEPATAPALPADARLASGAPRSLCRSCSPSLLLSRHRPLRALLALRSLVLPRGPSTRPERPFPPPGLRSGPTTPRGRRVPAGRLFPWFRALRAVASLVDPPLPPLSPPSLAEQPTSPSSLSPLRSDEALVVGELDAAEDTRRPSVRACGRLCVPAPSPPPFTPLGPLPDSRHPSAGAGAMGSSLVAGRLHAARLWRWRCLERERPLALTALPCSSSRGWRGRGCTWPPFPYRRPGRGLPAGPSRPSSSLSAAARSAHTTTARAAAAKAVAPWAGACHRPSLPAARLAVSCLAGALGSAAGPAFLAGPPSSRAGPCRAGPGRAPLSRSSRPRRVVRDLLRLRAAHRQRGARAAQVAGDRPRGALPCLEP